MISIEAYRSSIGRYYGRSKVNGKKCASVKGTEITLFLLIMTYILLFCYGLFVKIVGICYIHSEFIPFIHIYGLTISIICMCLDVFANWFTMTMNKESLMRENDETLYQCFPWYLQKMMNYCAPMSLQEKPRSIDHY